MLSLTLLVLMFAEEIQSINLTKIPIPSTSAKSDTYTRNDRPTQQYEYSSRDISPPPILIQQLIRAHAVFSLHHGHSLPALYSRHTRAGLCAMLDRFWSRFCYSWDLAVHGAPAAEIFGGMQLAAAGELGVGVGEEEWGAGEREVLEAFGTRTSGFIDMLVCRFGDAADPLDTTKTPAAQDEAEEPWIGLRRDPLSTDGVIFSGMNNVARSSMRDVAYWARSVYTFGSNAYGVRDNPISAKKRKPRRAKSSKRPVDDHQPGIPRSIINLAGRPVTAATTKPDKHSAYAPTDSSQPNSSAPPAPQQHQSWMKYLLLGYGTHWGQGDSHSSTDLPIDDMRKHMNVHTTKQNHGRFLIGLHGDTEDSNAESCSRQDANIDDDLNTRIMIRTLHVYVADSTEQDQVHSTSLSSNHSSSTNRSSGDCISACDRSITSQPVKTAACTRAQSTRRVRVLVYVHRPFVYVLLFDLSTAGLVMPCFYHNLHTFLSSLRDLLVRRTGIQVAEARRRAALGQSKAHRISPLWEIVHDADRLLTCSTMPGIDDGILPRLDALKMHLAALDILQTVQPNEHERRIKTWCAWWVCWARMLDVDTVPGAVPGTTPDTVPETTPDTVPDTVPGIVPGTNPDALAQTDTTTDTVPVTVTDHRSPRQPSSSHQNAFGSSSIYSKGSEPDGTYTFANRHGREILLFRKANVANGNVKPGSLLGWRLASFTAGSDDTTDSLPTSEDTGIMADLKGYTDGILGLTR